MKKISILVFTVYMGMLLYVFYLNRQYKLEHERYRNYWLLSGRNPYHADNTDPVNYTRWKSNIRVKIEGNASDNDIKIIHKMVMDVSDCIKPLTISFTDSVPNMVFYFKLKSEMPKENIANPNAIACYKIWMDSISNNTWSPHVYAYPNVNYTINAITKADLFIRTDSIDYWSKNQAIHDGFMKMLGDWGTKVSYRGSERFAFDNYILLKEPLKLDSITNKGYKKSVDGKLYWEKINRSKISTTVNHLEYFNNKPKLKQKLLEDEKDYLQLHYSPAVFRYTFDGEPRFYVHRIFLDNLMPWFIIVIILFIISLYFDGFFNTTIYSTIGNRTGSEWLSFFIKTFTASLIYVFMGAAAVFFLFNNSSDFKVYFSFFLSTIFIILSANSIYLTENILFPRFDQYIKRQWFTFLITAIALGLVSFIIVYFDWYYTETTYGMALSFGGIPVLFRIFYNLSGYKGLVLVQEKENELINLRELKTRAELNALQSKINPHFLYNALNTIAGLAHENADKVEHMALALSKLFRYSINKDDSDFTTVQNEVEMASIYLEIENVRFGDKLKYLVNVSEDISKEQIPKFIIQPLVENAIKHGISKITRVGELKLEIFRTDANLHIKVSDNGPDFPESLMTGYGLQSIYEKLDILYPHKYEISIQNGNNKNISVILKA